MGARILNRQRKMTEQGRLRFGVYTGTRPKALTTWIVSSHSEIHVRAAAHLWGGEVEQWQPQGNGAQQWRVITEASTIPAILPTGDPLNTAYELWTRGGCQRRCNGVAEKFSGSPCLCRAQFGEDFHEQEEGVCGEKTRLSVYLPDMPGLGVWRMETGSYYGTDEIDTKLDDIRGAVGDGVLIPILLQLEQRTKIRQGKTKQYVVPIMDLQGATFGELLAGAVAARSNHAVEHAEHRAVEGARPAIAAAAEPATADAPRNDERDAAYIQRAIECRTADQVRDIYREAVAAGHMHQILADQLTTVGRTKSQSTAQQEPPPAARPEDAAAGVHIKAALAATTLDQLTAALDRAQADGYAADFTDENDTVAAAFMGRRQLLITPDAPAAPAPASADSERLWAEIVTAASLQGFDRIEQIEDAFARRWNGDTPGSASQMQLATFLAELKDDKVHPPQAATASAGTAADSDCPF